MSITPQMLAFPNEQIDFERPEYDWSQQQRFLSNQDAVTKTWNGIDTSIATKANGSIFTNDSVND